MWQLPVLGIRTISLFVTAIPVDLQPELAVVHPLSNYVAPSFSSLLTLAGGSNQSFFKKPILSILWLDAIAFWDTKRHLLALILQANTHFPDIMIQYSTKFQYFFNTVTISKTVLDSQQTLATHPPPSAKKTKIKQTNSNNNNNNKKQKKGNPHFITFCSNIRSACQCAIVLTYAPTTKA